MEHPLEICNCYMPMVQGWEFIKEKKENTQEWKQELVQENMCFLARVLFCVDAFLYECVFSCVFSCTSSCLRGRFLVRVLFCVRVFLYEFLFACFRACFLVRVLVFFLACFLFFFYKFPAQIREAILTNQPFKLYLMEGDIENPQIIITRSVPSVLCHHFIWHTKKWKKWIQK